MRLGIDVGGTFTDVVLMDDLTKRIHYTKTLTTPGKLASGVLTGIEKILSIAGTSIADVDYIVHGTTIGTNALIERKGAKVGLITTKGFRDVLEIARIERPDGGLYDMTVDLPDPLVPRSLRFEAVERIGAHGEVVIPLDENQVMEVLEAIKLSKVESIAICLLFSFRNAAHETRIRELCSKMLTGIPVTISSEISPEFREYERSSTTVINAYLLPITQQYLQSLVDQLNTRYGGVDLRILQASGGAMTAEVAKTYPVHMVNSGPAGGAQATGLFGSLAGEDKVIGVDMGGTSFDISLVIGGKPGLRSESEIEGYPVKIPMIDVEGIGAGGGSIAWVDAGGALNVGPQSAGADPGPACYGLGGELPTVTDANLVLGRLNPEYFLGSEMDLYLDRAKQAVQKSIAEPMGISTEEAAAGIIRVVNANMVRGIGGKTTQKGYDVREFSLLAFGGAGPLHAVDLAEDLGMNRVIIPPYCSVFSAFGAVASDVRHDYVQTIALPQAKTTAGLLEKTFSKMEAHARNQLEAEHVTKKHVIIERAVDLRYEGQSYEITIPIPKTGSFTDGDIASLIQDFHQTHLNLYAYSDSNEPVEFINLRVVGIGKVPELVLGQNKKTGNTILNPKGWRPVFFIGHNILDTPVYEREDLKPAHILLGPALVEEITSTTVIPPGWKARIDAYSNIVLVMEGRADEI